MSRTRRTSTTKPTSKRAKASRDVRLTAWQSVCGVRHYALAKYEGDAPFLCDVFLPCRGYISDAFDTTDDAKVVTCVPCLSSRFKHVCAVTDLSMIVHLDEPDLIDYFLDHEALAVGYDPWQ